MERTLMAGNGDDRERALLQELSSAMSRVEPVPTDVVAAARDAFRWRTVAQAIAGLEFDSAVDTDGDVARVRSVGSDRQLRFSGPGRVVEVTVLDGGRRLVGRLDPPMAGEVILRRPSGPVEAADVDERGQFFFDVITRGSISLRPVPADPDIPSFDTEWVTI